MSKLSPNNHKDESLPNVVPVLKNKQTKHVKTKPKCRVHFGIHSTMTHLFEMSEKISFPYDLSTQVEAILNGVFPFDGDSLINHDDLKSLVGTANHVEDRWISIFVIDAYLKLLERKSSDKGIGVQIIPWEVFESSTTTRLVNVMSENTLLNKDVLLIPCNSVQAMHWFLLVVKLKQKIVIALDSAAGDYLKPTIQQAINKMASVLSHYTAMTDWRYFTNTMTDLPQQMNTYDCGAYICLYARCILGLSKMLSPQSIQKFRKHMLLSLHMQDLSW